MGDAKGGDARHQGVAEPVMQRLKILRLIIDGVGFWSLHIWRVLLPVP